jgi:branched-subunit amino acid transport protein
VTQVAGLLLLGLASWLLRIGLIVVVPAPRLPERLRDALDHGGPSVLAAVLVVGLAQTLEATPDAPGIAGTAAAAGVLAIVAWTTRSLAITTGAALVAVVLIDVVLA